ncbi:MULTISPECIES: formyltetrahydrofolate deformylase [unclassified Nocardioides]|uniref:formyltetrahydrofolate deformylase n=1 Tax=unclassified Nocardioides TaxID=2615069 RepID=UPI0009F0CAFE|nr:MULTISPECIES: formyltetrahydrofolate deformylase [unclassified Nocardioides]GAW47933.1 formyltetrahydrofolate deformylase [Nocardioides sp. PD653-B2]GAW53764.1 formyltetrahydrofolate deformylase [Nocardioides sp. PD653]
MPTAAATSDGLAAEFILTLTCAERPGIVYEVAAFLFQQHCTILESQQFLDREADRFYMRVQFRSTSGPLASSALSEAFAPVAEKTSAVSWRIVDAATKPRVLIMVSKFGHCLNDLLFRTSDGRLDIDVVAVVSNHTDIAAMAANYGVPFHHVPVTSETKPAAEHRLLELVDDLSVDLVVLARYMQILSDELCKELDGRAINIHHSMLPSFKGARPYHQAHARGVKLIGATAHYVTADLDEGPIIEQEVARVDHSMSAAEVTKLGRDNECVALARAVAWHTENRVLLDGHRTVVFP